MVDVSQHHDERLLGEITVDRLAQPAVARSAHIEGAEPVGPSKSIRDHMLA